MLMTVLPVAAVIPPTVMEEEEEDETGEPHADHVNKRIRRIPHIEGNYACGKSGDSALRRASAFWPGREWEKMPSGSVHCSFEVRKQKQLSVEAAIRHHLIGPFKRNIAAQLRTKPQFTMYVSPSAVDLFLSEDRTTAFLASPIVEPGPVVSMIHAVDEVMSDFDLETFYEPPKPHLSLAWTTMDVQALCEKVQSQADGEQHFHLSSKSDESAPTDDLLGIDVTSAVLRIGKENTVILLSDD
ncbi:poly(U)-specific 3'-to-5' RNA exonuclease [Perkinsus olseni]|uniref:U6 snRNA phosphodiesterase 1 n=1 Tax=Perkinsus olseni TaxID=32597 RepID=A0A7J6TVF7_PEROL|nr:poly(U)-specific 3'-to-5' RNA exonuclease [Perkinsus olseni]